MLTTLNLDDDVIAKLRREARRSGRPFKEVVNRFLRIGLKASEPPQIKTRFVVKARPLGLPLGLSYDNIGDLLE